MRWLRSHIQRGSWFALVALAINLTLSFGHIHAINGQRFASHIAAIASPDEGQSRGIPDSDQADLLCPICMATSAIGHALSAAPPILALTFAEPSLDLTVEHVFGLPQRPHAAFHSRGPPIS